MTDPTNKGLVNKSAVGLGERQFHIGVAPGELDRVSHVCARSPREAAQAGGG